MTWNDNLSKNISWLDFNTLVKKNQLSYKGKFALLGEVTLLLRCSRIKNPHFGQKQTQL